MSVRDTAQTVIKRYVSPVMALALVGTGVYGLCKPIEGESLGDVAIAAVDLSPGARLFGITTVQPQHLVFYPAMIGRNLSAGLAASALLWTNQYRALGWFYLCWANTGVWDVWTMMNAPQPVTNMWIHFQNIGLLTVVGSGLAGLW